MRRGLIPVSLTLVVGLASPAGVADDPTGSEPRKTGLVETTETRLVQLDVTITGPPEVVSRLTTQDLKVRVNLKKVREFSLDRLCATPEEGQPAAGPDDTPATVPATYLFYFDQQHLTLGGRARAMDLAKDLISRLVRDGSRAMIVSNARRLAVIEEFSTDAEKLRQAIQRLEGDRSQWQFVAEEEESRVAQVVERLNTDNDVQRAIGLARLFQREEVWRTDKSLRRFALTLSRLADVVAPKAVLYFADTLRENPGAHYTSFFGATTLATGPAGALTMDNIMSQPAFDRAVSEAAAHGVRVYAVLAQGLVTPFDRHVPSGQAVNMAQGGAFSSSSGVRQRDVEQTLTNLASETGGQAFVRGAGASKIARRIAEDFSCLYLISFSPGKRQRDAPLRVVVESRRDDVRVRARGRVVVQSDSARLASRLLSAFALDNPDKGAAGLEANLVPTGFSDGSYSALLQISVPGTTLPSAAWDVGASVVFRDKVREEISGRLSVRQPGVPVVFERELRLKPGSHEIVAVAHEASSDFVLSDHEQVDWPDPNARPATFGPIAVLQPVAGAFTRADDKRNSGSLARSELEPMSTELPTLVMGLICRGTKRLGPVKIERTLAGQSRVEFPPLELELAEERCAQVRDVIPADSLGPGYYRYEVRVLREGTPIHQVAREFLVGASEP